VWPQHLEWMWIERNDDGRTVRRSGMARRGRDDGLMTEMNAVEDADCEKDGARQVREF
jgi:hypothetical protein